MPAARCVFCKFCVCGNLRLAGRIFYVGRSGSLCISMLSHLLPAMLQSTIPSSIIVSRYSKQT
jgi:hypothetical protein